MMAFLRERIFDPILASDKASEPLKMAMRKMIESMQRKDAAGILRHYRIAVGSRDRKIGLGNEMKREGFKRLHDEGLIEEFRKRFPAHSLEPTAG
jgi:hypothetical protein